MNFFTSDSHFGCDAVNILKREMRPFISTLDYADFQIDTWNKQATQDDTIYHLGDFCNYNSNERDWFMGLQIIRQINAKVILIIGNNEERVIDTDFNGNFNDFRDFCIGLGFKEVMKDLYLSFNGRHYYLNHYPHNHKNKYVNLFGHTHRQTGVWKPYGLNVGTDLNHFRLYSENDIEYLISQKEKWWDNDIDCNCM